MLRKFALFMLAICLTVPAVAAPVCHQPAPCDMAAMAPTSADHHMQAASGDQHCGAPLDASISGSHRDCIGCAAPILLPSLARRDTLVPLAAHTPAMPALAALVSAPDLPPPRA